MARVSAQDVRHVAMLARLGLGDQRIDELTTDLNTILEHMEVLRRIETTGVDESAAMLESPGGMPLRDDRGPPIPLQESPESFAPDMRDGFFIVPRLSTHGDAGDGPESSA